MVKRMSLMLLGITLILGGVIAWNITRNYFAKQFLANLQPPPVTISTAPAKQVTWLPSITAVGNLAAIKGVKISPQIDGIIESINFNSGQKVQKHSLLVKLDDRVERAQLQNYKAQLRLAEINYERDLKLFKKKVTPLSQLDQSKAKLQQAQAKVAKIKALLAQKQIRAPFSGQLGIQKVDIGQYLSRGTPIVTLQATGSLYVNFSLPEKYLKNLKVGERVEVQVDAYPEEQFSGALTAINAKVNRNTHNMALQALIENPENKLYPGMFANIKIILPQEQKLITVPQTAISYSLSGNSIFVIEKDKKDHTNRSIRRFITIGERRGNVVAITQGLKAGEQVVISGQLKLQNHAKININNKVKLTA